jgi:hypothetical protein
VETKKYDIKKITEASKEPYSDEAIQLLMYRLNKRDEIAKQKNALKKQLADFGKALKELNKLHVELSKSKTEIADVTKTLNSVENLLTEK